MLQICRATQLMCPVRRRSTRINPSRSIRRTMSDYLRESRCELYLTIQTPNAIRKTLHCWKHLEYHVSMFLSLDVYLLMCHMCYKVCWIYRIFVDREKLSAHGPIVDRKSVTARNVVLQRCSQNCYLPFSECFPDSYVPKY